MTVSTTPFPFLWRAGAWLATMLMAVWLAACASAQLTNSWRAPEFAGPPISKVLVLGLSTSDATRRIFEDSFARALDAVGVSAQPGYPLLPANGAIPHDKLKAVLADSGAQAVLITRLLRVDQEVSVTPNMPPPVVYGGLNGWYGGAWAALPPTVETYKTFTIETTLWNATTEKVIWSGTTRSADVSDVARATNDLAKVLIAQMKKDGVI